MLMIKKLDANGTGFVDGLEMGNNTKVRLKDLMAQKISCCRFSYFIHICRLQ